MHNTKQRKRSRWTEQKSAPFELFTTRKWSATETGKKTHTKKEKEKNYQKFDYVLPLADENEYFMDFYSNTRRVLIKLAYRPHFKFHSDYKTFIFFFLLRRSLDRAPIDNGQK